MTNPYVFHHFKLNNFLMYVNGWQVPSEGLSLNTANTKITTMAYQTFFCCLGIHHANMDIQITHELYRKSYFMLLFDLTPDHSGSGGHTSLPDNGNIRIEFKFDYALSDALTVLLYSRTSIIRNKEGGPDFG